MIEIRTGSLAAALGVHRNTVRNWIQTGRLPAKPGVGRRYIIEHEKLAEFLECRGVSSEIMENLGSREPASSQRKEEHKPQPGIINREVPMSGKPVGSVMVVGGGIAGIQSSLDLAESGYYVYLVEKSPGIGGNMARLDKTFPTNDCAM